MKKLYTFAVAAVAALSINAQAIYNPGEHNNITTISISEELNEDYNGYPVEINIANPETPIRSCSAWMWVDDNSVSPWALDEDDEIAYDRNSDRTSAKNLDITILIGTEENVTNAGHLCFICTEKKADFKGNEGAIAAIYIDATKLSDGAHTLHVTEPLASFVGADDSSASYFSANQEIKFYTNGGKLSLTAPTPSSIDAITSYSAITLYDLQGRQVSPSAHGLYINNGRKVVK